MRALGLGGLVSFALWAAAAMFPQQSRAAAPDQPACDRAIKAAQPALPSEVFSPQNHLDCFVEQAKRLGLGDKYEPQRKSLLKAMQDFESNANNQQQSSMSSTATTSVVSKPSGPTQIIEDFGGLKVTPGTSSLTLQISPGTLISNLEDQGALLPCNAALHFNRANKDNCMSQPVARFLSRWTVAVTAQTSSSTQTGTGTAGGTASQLVSFITGSAGSPTFSGLSVKYGLYGKAKIAGGKESDIAALDAALLNQDLRGCTEFKNWQDRATEEFKGLTTMDEKRAKLDEQYALLFNMQPVTGSCVDNFLNVVTGNPDSINTLLTDFLIADAKDDLAMAKTPWMSFEYDLTTPTGKPSYSSAKVNLSRQWGTVGTVSKAKAKAAASAVTARAALTGTSSGGSLSPAEDLSDLCAWAVAITKQGGSKCKAPPSRLGMGPAGASATAIDPRVPATIAKTVSAQTSSAVAQDTAAKTQAAAASGAKTAAAASTPQWTVTATLTADVFDHNQMAIAPSASRLRDFQGAVEADYIIPLQHWTPQGQALKGIVAGIGNPTLAASYLYQDQTSPSILTGAPSTITFVGLPSTASTAYAARGIIHLAQLRLGLGTGSNLKFPIAVTYSNRSELLPNHTFGVQFGLAYNLTSGLSSKSSN